MQVRVFAQDDFETQPLERRSHVVCFIGGFLSGASFGTISDDQHDASFGPNRGDEKDYEAE